MGDETRRDERILAFLCECDDLACDERVALTSMDYEWLPVERQSLALASGHRPGSAAGDERRGADGW